MIGRNKLIGTTFYCFVMSRFKNCAAVKLNCITTFKHRTWGEFAFAGCFMARESMLLVVHSKCSIDDIPFCNGILRPFTASWKGKIETDWCTIRSRCGPPASGILCSNFLPLLSPFAGWALAGNALSCLLLQRHKVLGSWVQHGNHWWHLGLSAETLILAREGQTSCVFRDASNSVPIAVPLQCRVAASHFSIREVHAALSAASLRPESQLPFLSWCYSRYEQATEILTSLRSEKPNGISSEAPAIGKQLRFWGEAWQSWPFCGQKGQSLLPKGPDQARPISWETLREQELHVFCHVVCRHHTCKIKCQATSFQSFMKTAHWIQSLHPRPWLRSLMTLPRGALHFSKGMHRSTFWSYNWVAKSNNAFSLGHLSGRGRFRVRDLLFQHCKEFRLALKQEALQGGYTVMVAPGSNCLTYAVKSSATVGWPGWPWACKGGPHHVSKKSTDFRCQKRSLWQGAAPKVPERSANVETLSLYMAKFWRVQRCNFFRVGNRNLYSFLFALPKVAPLDPDFSLSVFKTQHNRNWPRCYSIRSG